MATDWSYAQILRSFSTGDRSLLRQSKHALERECLRINKDGSLAQTPHPFSIGSALTHPYITTDFCEAQLELITPPFAREKAPLQFLKELHRFIHDHLKNEWIWPCSAPCPLPKGIEIPLAQYGSSYDGQMRTLYRNGLSYRYGRKMQTLSGIHYNFSLSQQTWEFLHQHYGNGQDLSTFISTSYLKLVRNYLRLGWLGGYLFGATPAFDTSYFSPPPKELKRLGTHTLYGEFSTSLRMSDIGYYSKVQKQAPISFNTLPKYIEDLQYAISTPHPSFSKIGASQNGEPRQINDHILQIEAEHYSRIRPKPPSNPKESPLTALQNHGVAYVETRSIDVNPFTPEGIDLEELRFHHIFLLYCLFEKSPFLKKKDQEILMINQEKASLEGRNPLLRLYNGKQWVGIKQWGTKILERMAPIANILDSIHNSHIYQASLEKQKNKLNDPSLTPSSKILDTLKKEKISFKEFALTLAKDHWKQIKQTPLSEKKKARLDQIAKESLQSQELIEIHDDFLLKGYEDLEVSTQMVIREAKKRGVQVEILDRKANFFRLKKGNHTELVKQATKTSKESLISYFAMENKEISKKLLREQGLLVPQGAAYGTVDSAINDYHSFARKKLVVKPNHTNYGIGVSFVEPKSPVSFAQSVKQAFIHSEEVIVEEFCKGKEYRFLVIDGKTLAICERLPANVTGDGIHSIAELISLKNRDPYAYKIQYPIHLGKTEKAFLANQNLKTSSIPKKGKQIFLRENSNVSTGGDPIDVTDQVPKIYSKIACKAASIVNSCFCGVDMIIPNLHSKKPTYSIIELNFNPAIFLHRYPVKGKKRKVEEAVLDVLGF